MAYKILWLSPHALHDYSSGAAAQVLSALKELNKRDIQILSYTATIFDSAVGAKKFFAEHQEKISPEAMQKRIFNFSQDKINFHYQLTNSEHILAMNMLDMSLFQANFLQIINQFRPDIILSIGESLLHKILFQEAKKRKIPVGLFILNPGYLNLELENIDFAVCESLATKQFYARANKNIQNCGIFIEKDAVYAPNKSQEQYITFINPSPEKGVNLVIKLMQMAKKDYLNTKFLIVENRGSIQKQFAALNLYPEDFSNLELRELTSDMREIYSQSRLILMPSLWFESWGRVGTEAIINGIPVLASKSGGLTEAIGPGGIFLDVPEKSLQNYNYMPSEAEMQIWYENIRSLLSNQDLYNEYSQKATEYAGKYSLETSTNNLLAVLQAFLAQKASNYF